MTHHRFIVTDAQRRHIRDMGEISDVLELPRTRLRGHHTVVLQERKNGQWCDVREL